MEHHSDKKNKQVGNAGYHSHDPNTDPEDGGVEEVREGGDAISLGLADPHLGSVAAQFKGGEVAVEHSHSTSGGIMYCPHNTADMQHSNYCWSDVGASSETNV